MKKTFSWFMALFTGIVLLVTGCSNASQVTFNVPNEGNFTNDGLAAVTINAGFREGARSIWPNEWQDTDKGKLLYELKGDPISTLASTVFRYDQIIKNEAVVDLLPVSSCKLVLTAYQVENDKFLDKDITGGRPVLWAEKTADLTKGSQTVIFNLDSKPLGGTSLDAATTGNGEVDVTVNFYKEKKIDAVKFEVINGNSYDVNVLNGDIGATTTVTAANGIDMISLAGKAAITSGIGNTTITDAKFAEITSAGAEDYYTANLSGILPAGNHTLKVIFYTMKDGADASKNASYVESQAYQDSIYIEGGNVSSTVIDIPRGVMNKAPTAPINLQYSATLNSATATTVCANGANAQILTDAATVVDTYLLTLKWEDTALNETEFKVVFSDAQGDENESVTITNNGGNNVTVTGAGTKYAASSGTNQTDVAKIKYSSGSLAAGSRSVTITLEMPTALTFNYVNVYAENEMTKNDVKANSCQLAGPIGMKTVTYCLQSKDPNEVAVVTHGSGAFTNGGTEKYFVMGYKVGTPVGKFMNTASYPFVKLGSGNYALTGWASSAAATLDDNNPVLGSDYTVTDNIYVFPRWSVETAVNITFPGYNDYRDLGVLDSSVQNPIVYDSYNITTGVPNSDKIIITAYKPVTNTGADGNPLANNYKFAIIGPNGATIYDKNDILGGGAVDEPLITQGTADTDNVLTWNPSDPKFVGGVYRVIISYDYDPDGNTPDVGPKPAKNISGTVYVDVRK